MGVFGLGRTQEERNKGDPGQTRQQKMPSKASKGAKQNKASRGAERRATWGTRPPSTTVSVRHRLDLDWDGPPET